ncbi:uncharacterized protein LOC142168226 [Nicotiana tabacum]|uniref:Uncharacterized protein LOC142168226 n=1 Tax=Nicotiana tabacum TaxID=4097 RepID=A0AC58SJ23_TOBAC
MTIADDSSNSTTAAVEPAGTVNSGNFFLDHNHPLYLHPSDGPGSLSNRDMKVALLGKNKLCLIDGTTLKGDFGPGLAHQWDRCNTIVTSWLMSNVNSHLLTSVLFSENAQTVWAQLKE